MANGLVLLDNWQVALVVFAPVPAAIQKELRQVDILLARRFAFRAIDEAAERNGVEKVKTIDKDHGRFEVRNYSVSHQVDWYAAERSYPGAPRFPQLTTIAMVESRIERGDKIESERRSYISSRALSAAAFAAAARGHWAIENKLHWVLDVTFGEDLSRLRTGHGAKNMAVVRHFALNLVRQVVDKRSIKRRRKRAAWDPQYLLDTLGPLRPKPC